MQLSTHCKSEDNILCCKGFDADELLCWDQSGNGIILFEYFNYNLRKNYFLKKSWVSF